MGNGLAPLFRVLRGACCLSFGLHCFSWILVLGTVLRARLSDLSEDSQRDLAVSLVLRKGACGERRPRGSLETLEKATFELKLAKT
jgi:hypothetical protein